jgi:hypothetical protein
LGRKDFLYRYRFIRVHQLICQSLLFLEDWQDKKTILENHYFCWHYQQIITGLKISRHPVHDISHAEKLLKQCHKVTHSDLYVMDKGYDSAEIHELIRDTLNSYALILSETENVNESPEITERGSLNRSIW